MSIRFKVILPYLLLTLLIAVSGAFVVTRLVSSSLEERLTNQLLEAGRVVSDQAALQETTHIQDARIIAFTRGLGKALKDGDADQITVLAKPAAGGASAECVMVFDYQGREVLHTIKQDNSEIQDVTRTGTASALPIVDDLLTENDTESLPHRMIAKNLVDDRYYYFTSIPISFEGNVVGVVVVGTSLDGFIQHLKATASADVVVYDDNGQAFASTLGISTTDPLFYQTLSIDKDFYTRILNQDEIVEGENFKVSERQYRSGFSPLKVSDDRIAVFAVILPLDFVVDSNTVNRNNYIFLYSLAMVAVILVGYYIARMIIKPLSSLVRTSRAIADGDLTRRTGVQTNDEIGLLASTFDVMTQNLQERTIELEKTNKILEQMDRTKIRFIQVSAHELRTPLTLVQGYAQIIHMKSKESKEFEKYSKGIMDGAARMVDIIDNLLDVSRIDSNLLDINAARVEIDVLIKKAEKSFATSFTERNMNFKTEGLADLPAVQADGDMLYKVFYHVIGNAIKYTPDGGTITVSGCLLKELNPQPEIEIEIKDTGIGIDPQYQELVFEKFFQTGEVLMHSSGKTKFKGGGPGLGLAIARGIMDAHHGKIWLESPGHDEAKNPGTTVFIRIPINGKIQ